eukprot:CAMPEP_0177259948 /NCGR_PEP_ID=MMETSP0367-20130122/58952_1 /TAXON_ID=447022 ORGANISM="Scrippsiella hangoei-like, Strain SHHI-4" /NCGR_SAMPLE_ID=MMETSP0367 /ASSEMBLY_ACC=CAM_ASM_000362 /LENGTH=48 /DNA_ID= /DNA_START= /DNA_END= /DNA_ORIENTATION=
MNSQITSPLRWSEKPEETGYMVSSTSKMRVSISAIALPTRKSGRDEER